MDSGLIDWFEAGLLYDVSNGACSTTTYPVGDAGSLCSGGGASPVSSSTAVSSSKASSLYTPTTLATVSSTSTAATSSGTGTAGCTWEGHCLGMYYHFLAVFGMMMRLY